MLLLSSFRSDDQTTISTTDKKESAVRAGEQSQHWVVFGNLQISEFDQAGKMPHYDIAPLSTVHEFVKAVYCLNHDGLNDM